VERLTVSIIVHQDFSYIHELLTTLGHNQSESLNIYVTINAGDKQSIAHLQASFPQVTYLVNETPIGFAENHNRVMTRATTPFVALLNDDISLSNHVIPTILDYLDAHTHVGLVTPRIVNPDGTPQLTAFSDPTLLRMIYKISGLGHFTRQGSYLRRMMIRTGLAKKTGVASLSEYDETVEIPVAVGVAMFVRRTAYEQAGLMDEVTRVYGEEIGWHWRLRQAGWQIVLLATVAVVHFNVDKDIRDWKLAEHRKGMLNYFSRYRATWKKYSLCTAILLFHTLRGAFNTIFDRKRAGGDWQTVRMAWSWLMSSANQQSAR
jgi:GT2 family glycosyltransferase